MKQIKSLIVMLSLVILMHSCNKEADNLMEYQPTKSTYSLVDSVVKVINTIDSTSILTSYPINRNIDIISSFAKEFIVYNSDTLLYDSNIYGYLFKGGYPHINFKSDSITIMQKVDSVGIQIWNYKHGIRIQ